jgi:uncharacterized protein
LIAPRQPLATAEPTARINTLDVIRGVALMGILLMNIVSFAMPEVAYTNPRAFGSHGAFDYAAWAVNFVAVNGKMRGLFSLLFGASMLLVVERAEAKSENPGRVHGARMAWLFVFGMAHLLLVWSGDILQHYALVGAFAYAFREAEPRKLVGIAIALIAAQTLLLAGLPIGIHGVEVELHRAHPTAAAIDSYQDYARSFGVPDRAYLAADVAACRGSYLSVFHQRFDEAIASPLQTLLFVGLETLAYMLLGMAALKTGMLAGAWPRIRYLQGAVIGLGAGVVCYGAMAWWVWARGFDLFAVALTAMTLSTPIRPVMIGGWVCLILLAARRNERLTARIAAAGRMAFTNYLMTSLICTTLFYGYGLGWYGTLSRAELYGVVAAIWAAMLLWSQPWLARFRYGPLEWLWRSLSRWQLQPMRGGVA